MAATSLFLVILLAHLSFGDDPPVVYSKANSDFTSDLFYNVIQEKEAENVIVSPASIQTCLAMAFFGSNGKTSDELIAGLHFTTSDKSVIASKSEKKYESLSPSIKFANRIYLDNQLEIKPEFNELVGKSFKASAENLDFKEPQESAKQINQWIEENTNGRIKNMIQSEHIKVGKIIMVNAVYFNATWQEKFNKKKTKKVNFWMDNEKSTKVDMMSNLKQFKYAEFEDLQAKAVELPYKNTDFSMMLILPNDKDGLKNLETKLHNADLMELALKLEPSAVTVEIPKFEINYELQLNDVLKNMGMKTMFSPEADFSNLLNSGNSFVSDVIHKTFIAVHEDGTEAAASTGIVIATLGAIRLHPPFKKFVADHPFIFVIKDKTTIYFMGHITHF